MNTPILKLERPICFFDLETTGVDVEKDRIVEISICKVYTDWSREVKTRRVNPLIQIPKEATDVHGISNEDVKDEPTFAQIAKGIYSFIDGCDVGGFNCNRFDIPLLNNEFTAVGIRWAYQDIHFIDAGNIFKIQEPRTLSAAVKFYLGKEMESAHSAEADITATVDVFIGQLAKYPDMPKSIPELAKFSNFDKEVLDLSGWFSYDKDGDIIFLKGKHIGKKAKENLDYVQWMAYKINPNFPPDVCKICNQILGWK